MNKLIGLILLFSITSLISNGQDFPLIDNLNERSEEYWNYNHDSVLFYAERAFELSNKSNYANGKAQSLINLCFSCYAKGDYVEAIKMCEKSIETAISSDEEINVDMAHLFLGLIYINQANYDEAIQVFLPLLENATEKNNTYLMADVCGNLGLAYLSKKDYQKAFEYLNKSKDLHEEVDHPNNKIYVYLNIGWLHFNLNQFDSAYHYLSESSCMANEIKSSRSLMYSHSLLGQIALFKKDLEQAQIYLTNAYSIADSLEFSWEIANNSSLLSELYYEKGEYEKAIDFGNNAINLAEDNNALYIIQKSNNIIAKSYIDMSNYAAAEKYFLRNKFIIDSLSNNDSIGQITSKINLDEMKAEQQNFTVVKNELKIAKAELARRNIFNIAAVITIALSIIILLLILQSNKRKTKNNQKLQALNDEVNAQKDNLEKANSKLDGFNREKDLLLGIVAHDIRSPLNKISGLLNILKLDEGLNKEQIQIEGMVQNTINDAKILVDELLEISQIESGSFDKNEENTEISEFIHNTIYLQKSMANEKEININPDVDCHKTHFTFDNKIVQRILDNLISNGIKYSDKCSDITVSVKEEQDNLKFSVLDSGRGIPREEQNILFRKFGKTSTRPTSGESSNGLGLYIVDRLTKALGGRVTFKSELGIGSEFSFSFPIQ